MRIQQSDGRTGKKMDAAKSGVPWQDTTEQQKETK